MADKGVAGYDSRKYVAELIGTMALVFFGCGAAVLAGKYIGFLGIAFSFGMVLLVLVYSIGPISGCHVNPAVTIAMLAARKISARDATVYIIVQCIGAVIGAELLFWIALGMPNYTIDLGLGANGYDASSPGLFTMQAGLVAEVVLTFFFLLAIFGATSKEAPKGFAGVAIGMSLFIVHLVGIPVTGTSVNPARSLGPALVLGANGSWTALNQLWLFWLAPIIGGIFAAAVWILALSPEGTGAPAAPEPPRMIKVKGIARRQAGPEKPRTVKERKAKDEEEEDDLEDLGDEEAGEAEEDEEDRKAAMEHDYEADGRVAREAEDEKEHRAAEEAEDEEDEDEDEEDEKDQEDEENVVKYEDNKPKGGRK